MPELRLTPERRQEIITQVREGLAKVLTEEGITAFAKALAEVETTIAELKRMRVPSFEQLHRPFGR